MGLELTVMSLDFEAEEATRTATYDQVELRIGRDPHNDVVLQGEDISASHALITLDTSNGQPEIYVTDLGSTNGTLIDSKRLPANQPFLLQSNQRILIGEYLIKPSMITELANRARSGEGVNDDFSITEEKRPDIRIIKGGKIIKSNGENNSMADENTLNPLDSIADSFNDYYSSVESNEEATDDDILIQLESELSENTTQNTTIKTAGNSVKTPEQPQEPKKAASVSNSSDVRVQAIASAETCEFNLVAKKLVSLTGSVVHKGKPLEGVLVDAGSYGTVTTDANGVFEFENIVEGSPFEIEITKASFSFDGTSFAGSVEEEEPLIFHATELFIISGIIGHRGKGLPGVTVDGGILGTTVTDQSGRYEFTDVPEGTEFSLTASKDGYVFEIA